MAPKKKETNPKNFEKLRKDVDAAMRAVGSGKNSFSISKNQKMNKKESIPNLN
jgi:hypothetical protein